MDTKSLPELNKEIDKSSNGLDFIRIYVNGDKVESFCAALDRMPTAHLAHVIATLDMMKSDCLDFFHKSLVQK